MQSIYFYDENHNLGTIEEITSRYDTPYQQVSNDSFKEIRAECVKYDINFDFLASNALKPDDIVIVSNLSPFRRKHWLTNSISIKNKLLNKRSGFINLQKLIKRHKETTFLPYLWEAQVTEPKNWEPSEHNKFSNLLVWDTELVKRNPKKYKLLNLQSGPLGTQSIKLSAMKKGFSERSNFLSTIVNAKGDYRFNSGYKLRIDIVSWYGHNASNNFVLYGGGWPSYLEIAAKNQTIPDRQIKNIRAVYKGTVAEKKTVIDNSKFYLCIENSTDRPGYVTEKFFDALVHQCLPVYLGYPGLYEFVPKEAYIDLRQFNGDVSAMNNYLLKISKSEWEARVEMGQKFLHGEIGNIERFLPKGIANQLNVIQLAVNPK